MIVAIQKDSAFYRREIMRSSQNSFRDILDRSMHDFLLPIIREKIGKPKHPFLTAENITEILHNEISKVFVKVLECAGVYKRTEEGQAAFMRFVDSL